MVTARGERVKKVVSVSLGTSQRDYTMTLELLGQKIRLQRIGTGGSLQQAGEVLKAFDGQVDVLALGGINIYYQAGQYRFPLREAQKLIALVEHTPVVDGAAIKNVVERQTIKYLSAQYNWPRADQRVLVVSALDRWGMAEELAAIGCQLTIGDALFALGLPLPFYSLKTFQLVARCTVPLLAKLPIGLLYPLGVKQQINRPKWTKVFKAAQVIAGDFHFMRYNFPLTLPGRDVITSTVTDADRDFLQQRGIKYLVTTSPNFGGRSLGANVLQGLCVALLDKPPQHVSPTSYVTLLRQLGWQPRVERLN